MTVGEHPFGLEEASDGSADGPVTFRISGEIDVATAAEVESRLLAVVRAGRPVVVEAGEVTFVDSSGLRALVTARQEAEASAVSFRLGERSSAVDRLLHVTGLDDIFPAS